MVILREHHDDLRERAEPGAGRGSEPGGPDVRSMRHAGRGGGCPRRDRPVAPRSLTWPPERGAQDKNGWRGTGFEADRAGPHAGDRLMPAAAFAVLDSSV